MLRYGNKVFEFYGIKTKQANKIAARKAYEDGKYVFLLACDMRPNNMWQGPCMINKRDSDISFENKVNYFTYYNCDNERGKYPVFFIEIN